MEPLEVSPLHHSAGSRRTLATFLSLRTRFVLCILSLGIVAAFVVFFFRPEGDGRDASSVLIVPVRLLFIRHGFSCANAGVFACKDPQSKMLWLDAVEQENLFDSLDIIGTNVAAPVRLPRLNRSFGFQQNPSFLSGHKHADCVVRQQPESTRRKRQQPDESGNNPNDTGLIKLSHLYQDPLLTNCAAYVTARAGEALRKYLDLHGLTVDFIGASSLMRTVETAIGELLPPDIIEAAINGSLENCTSCIFSASLARELAVAQLPFLTEQDLSWCYQADNRPLPWEQQAELLRARLGEERAKRVDREFLQGYSKEQIERLAWPDFMYFAARRLLPELLKRRGEDALPRTPIKDAPILTFGERFVSNTWYKTAKSVEADASNAKIASPLTLVLASHSGVMQHVCGIDPPGPSNNAVAERLMIYEVHTNEAGEAWELVLRDQSDNCNLLLTAPGMPESIELRDVANCNVPFDYTKAFVTRDGNDANEDGGDGKAKTSCEQMADAVGAFAALQRPTPFHGPSRV
eukprot:TRINITY_DN72285_c0_g1_i1.p1 TRINITY_DN72285_c0_g1~~TRINITY_DN72285_c0_g1_i1.p1  ORF type:complete len:520 (-),score=62.46 TRINITY_DN72285_c0_g1_i1:178-1737(-)